MEVPKLSCQKLCDPAEGVCFLRLEIDRVNGEIDDITVFDSSDPAQNELLDDANRLLKDCRVMGLAKAAIESPF